jgi:hybrid cluster-associated redox disulfide protein
MKASIAPIMTIQELFDQFPLAVPVFFRYRMDCVGCWLQRFCTLNDAAVSYAIPLKDLLDEIQQAVNAIQRREI